MRNSVFVKYLVDDSFCSWNNLISIFFLFQNSIRHNLSLHSRFVRVQNEGTGKSSWWMLNPDAKPGGKTSRRRTPSVDGAGNPMGPRGIDYKRRGRSKKPAAGNIRNGIPRNGSTPSPSLPTPGGLHGMIDMYEEGRNIHPHYPFATDLRSHISGNGDYGRMSPPSIRGDGSFIYPSQDSWPTEYPQCGIQGYYAGTFSLLRKKDSLRTKTSIGNSVL